MLSLKYEKRWRQCKPYFKLSFGISKNNSSRRFTLFGTRYKLGLFKGPSINQPPSLRASLNQLSRMSSSGVHTRLVAVNDSLL